MPPKKSDEDLQSLPPFKAITILPIMALPAKRLEEVNNWLTNKKLSIQKNLNAEKIVEILKDKGLYVQPKKDPKDPKTAENVPATERGAESERILKEVGIDLVAKNYSTIHSELIVQARRQKKDKLQGKDSVAPKKQAKKEGKKDGKKESKMEEVPVIQEPKTVEKVYKMDFDGFVVMMDYPRTAEDLDKIIDSNDGLPADIVLYIEERTMWDWKEPSFQLLKQQPKDIEQLKKEMESPTKSVAAEKTHQRLPSQQDQVSIKKGRQLFNQLLQRRQKSPAGSAMRKLVTQSLAYELNPYKPEESTPIFVDKMFAIAAEFSFDKTNYQEWAKGATTVPMIAPIKIIEKVAAEEKQEDPKAKKEAKKDGKKESKEDKPPEMVEKVRLIRYQDQPENIRSDLRHLTKVNMLRKPILVAELLENIIESLQKQKQQNLLKENQQEMHLTTKEDVGQTFKKQYQLLKYPRQLSTQESKRLLLGQTASCWDESLLYRSVDLKDGIDYSQTVAGPKYTSLACLNKIPSSRLFRYFVLCKFERMLKQSKAYRDWSFINRDYIEHYDRNTLVRAISKELESEPQILTCGLPQDNLKLIVMLHENPPGRVLYHNQIQNQKSLPNLESWVKNFKSNPINLNRKEFFDYSEETIGNVGTLTKIMMPTDNAPIKEIVDNVGYKKIPRHQVIKETSRFGLRKSESGPELWVLLQDIISLTVTAEEILDVTVPFEEESLKQENQQNNNQTTGGNNSRTKFEQTIWLRSSKIIYKFWPYATFFRLDSEDGQIKRNVGSKGQIVRYFKDKSIWIGYSNGDTAYYRGGSWVRIINNRRIKQGHEPEELATEVLLQGNKHIHVREDETIIITEGQIKTVVFKDGTTIVTDSVTHTTTTYNKDFPTVRIRLEPHKFVDENIIGYGSAYALLGHDNLFERSCDGYIYEVFSHTVKYYLYHEKVDRQGTLTTSPVRLLCFEEGSVLKVSPQELIYIANEDKVRMDQQDPVQYWLQLFTTKENWKEGVYHIDLNEGSLQTLDAEGNHFKLYLDKQSDTKIAVSLNINGSAGTKEQPSFGNGYHVVKENFFLPTPVNFIEPKLFVVKSDGTGMQFLCESQLSNFLSRSQQDGYDLHEEKIDNESTYLQFSKTIDKTLKKQVEKFTVELADTKQVKFNITQIPRSLRVNPPTLQQKPLGTSKQTLLRSLIKYQPLTDYKEFTAIIEEYDASKDQIQHRLKTDYRIMGKEEFLP